MDFQKKIKLLKYVGGILSLYAVYKYKKNIHNKYSKEFYKFNSKIIYKQINNYYNQILIKEKEQDQQQQQKKYTIIIFSGNPSSVYFYEKFATLLSEQTKKKFDIICIGQAGQFSYNKKPNLKSVFCLEKEIDHKYQFIMDYHNQNPDQELIIIGHSIGCYLICQNLRKWKELGVKIRQIYLLFPAIENLVKTPNGIPTRYMGHFGVRHFFAFVFFIMSILPKPLQRYLAYKQAHIKDKDDLDIIEASLVWGKYSNVLNLLYMWYFEQRDIKDFDTSLMEEFKDQLFLYYGKKDNWCPIENYHRMKKLFPDNVELDKHDLEHAFVQGGSEIMAEILGNRILSL